ncbi:MAG: hypothetical protein NE334_08210 [Lentisphaeraceae bacterium]|nr:hypothetical protein [Lentisphaeraceae bacterium]
MKFYIFISLFVFLSACSSSSSSKPTKKEAMERLDDTEEQVVNIDVVDSSREDITDKAGGRGFQEAFLKKKAWFKMNDRAKEMRRYRSLTKAQLESTLKDADEGTTTLLIQVFEQKGISGISLLASLLEDTRETEFGEDSQLYWYEEKNKPAEKLEIRTYAANMISKVLRTYPSGVKFFFHKLDTSDKGKVTVLYATQGEYAINKEDTAKAWLAWWDKFHTDFDDVK